MNAERLLQHFERLSEAPEAIPRLRRFILDLVVRGQLLEQDPNDEPATELLKRIQTEKGRLLKEGKVRKTKTLEPLADGDIPFSLPFLWTATRLGIAYDVRDETHDTPKYVDIGYPLITSKNLSTGQLSFDDIKFISEQDHRQISERSLVERGDILLAMIGSIGNPVIVNTDCAFSIKNVALFKYFHRPSSHPGFLRLFLQNAASEMQQLAAGGLQPFVSLGFLRNYPFPLPPLAEQHRIVAKVDELMALCDDLEVAKTEREQSRDRLVAASLQRLNQPADDETFRGDACFTFDHLPHLTTHPKHIKQLRQTILNLAVRGKLVPQDPNDEPVAELLERILAEKARLVKEGKIRKQNPQAEIALDELPFALPNLWVWARLGDVIHLISGQHLQPGEYSNQSPSGLPYITGPADFGEDGLVITRYAVVRKAVAKHGQVLLTVKGAGIGKTAICDLPEVAISRQLMAMTAIAWSQDFLLLMTHRLAETLKESARSLIPGISREDVDQFVFALPPLAEQHRIVAKINELMARCDQLEIQLSTTATDSRRLLEAVLHEALTPALKEAA